MGEEPLVGGLAQGQIQPHLFLRHAEVLAEHLNVQRQQRGLAGRAERQADVGRTDHLARQHTHGLPDLLAEHRAAHGAHHPDQRARHGLHLLGQHIAHGQADTLGDRVDELLPRRERRLDPLGTAPRHGGVRAGGQRGRSVQPQVGEPYGLLDRGALGRTHTLVLGAVRRALRDRLARDLLGHVPVHGTALVAQHLAELLEGRAQVVRIQRTEHRGERIVTAAPTEPEGIRRELPAGALATSGGILLLALVAVLRLLRRKAESEWGVTHGFPRLVGPPASCRRRLPDNTTQRRHPGRIWARCSADSWPAAGWTPPGADASFAYVLKTTAGDAW